MPYKDNEINKRKARISNRGRRHGNWRQSVINSNFMCCYVSPVDGSPCGSRDNLQLHHTLRVEDEEALVCDVHHTLFHLEYNVNPYANHRSRLVEDIEIEIEECGGVDSWIARFGLDSSTAGVLTVTTDKENRTVVMHNGAEPFTLDWEVGK